MEKQVLTQEELNFIKNLQESNQDLINKFGQVEFQIQKWKVEKKKLQQEFEQNKQREIQFSQELQLKYGNGTINIDTGEFIPSM